MKTHAIRLVHEEIIAQDAAPKFHTGLLLHPQQSLAEEVTHQRVKLVNAPFVKAWPLTKHGLVERANKNSGVGLFLKHMHQLSQVLRKLLLHRYFVSHPQTVEEALPELEKFNLLEGSSGLFTNFEPCTKTHERLLALLLLVGGQLFGKFNDLRGAGHSILLVVLIHHFGVLTACYFLGFNSVDLRLGPLVVGRSRGHHRVHAVKPPNLVSQAATTN
mmetsp:Transcript_12703/g.24647  ORF Transcript_12703/g.24647 Transcript_12703/m.24647 type:complete len:217 (-) Transcript_12703:138-788(-)